MTLSKRLSIGLALFALTGSRALAGDATEDRAAALSALRAETAETAVVKRGPALEAKARAGGDECGCGSRQKPVANSVHH